MSLTAQRQLSEDTLHHEFGFSGLNELWIERPRSPIQSLNSQSHYSSLSAPSDATSGCGINPASSCTAFVSR